MPLARHHQMMKMGRGAPSAIFKIDAYDERFLSSSVVTCGVENSAFR